MCIASKIKIQKTLSFHGNKELLANLKGVIDPKLCVVSLVFIRLGSVGRVIFALLCLKRDSEHIVSRM